MQTIHILKLAGVGTFLLLLIINNVSCQSITSGIETRCDWKRRMEQKVEGLWLTWDEWGSCQSTVTCGKGIRTRSRSCQILFPLSSKNGCPGNEKETEECIVEPCKTCFGKVDLIFVLDSSTSIGEDNYQKMLQFCKSFLTAANASLDTNDVNVGIVSFSSAATVEFYLNNNSTKSSLYSKIDNIPWRYGSTNIADALRIVHNVMFTEEKGDRPDVDNIAVLIADGFSNMNSRRTVQEAEEAKRKKIHIYAIGIGLPDMRELNAVATYPASRNVFPIVDFRELERLSEKMFKSICPVFAKSLR